MESGETNIDWASPRRNCFRLAQAVRGGVLALMVGADAAPTAALEVRLVS
jgi:hypothetical protein